MRLSRTAAAGVALVAAVGPLSALLAGPAGADPVNAKKAEVIALDCDTLGTLEIATNGNGDWTPGLVTSGNRVLIPYKFHFEFTPTGSSETFTEDVAKPAPRNGRNDVCTFAVTEPDGRVTGTVWLTYTPAH